MGGQGVKYNTTHLSQRMYWSRQLHPEAVCSCDHFKNFEDLDNKEKPLVGDINSDMSAIFKAKQAVFKIHLSGGMLVHS